jgi:hypothetical protein
MVELIQERHDLLYDLFFEIMEDAALIKAIVIIHPLRAQRAPAPSVGEERFPPLPGERWPSRRGWGLNDYKRSKKVKPLNLSVEVTSSNFWRLMCENRV